MDQLGADALLGGAIRVKSLSGAVSVVGTCGSAETCETKEVEGRKPVNAGLCLRKSLS
jgi:hypothetical protein